MARIAAPWNRHQVALYLAAIALGSALGLLLPQLAPLLRGLTTPLLVLLLFATFLGVPLAELGRALRGGRFLLTLLVLDFVALPLVVFGLSRFVAHDQALLAGVLLVLLTPCVDYVVVFTGIAGGDRARLLSTTPVLMLLQLVLLPAYLWLMGGPGLASRIDPLPFIEAFLLLIVLPLAAAAAVQLLARRMRGARTVEQAAEDAMVPLMMLTLAIVVGSQIAAVGAAAVSLAGLVPLYLGFAAIATACGLAATRLARLPVPEGRALTLSGVTRNSLVVLPLALALPSEFALAPLAVVTQTLVELVVLVVLVRLLPRLPGLRSSGPAPGLTPTAGA
ncbi:arsenic resistance protein [Herbiconiux moechotypicola]|uniref:Arsenic resistance protein n=1 Tax=Herbiconiux moechotypicola TaxID=637393 RepID=A0ABP5R702_9MICO|nr:arsenic resistance protein [Herbiconiux moechotypicola]MCS5732061.1 arsenic resistance protein [Herbiconiux moechotypicola]